ncbi:DUF1365 domain-containing protein [Catenovulum sp. SM1970]|uniref:DUF1365 domain-containing protein n=1 Tax=Marinifaba aquimaris TaxID=2741323 RepID=UPI0015722088|nr:DUF1365 domain-containing protein [Marinifaba aquimaris]NTS76469.1 DUF1365 domain-containing protein [Marinifaba aquimaris]
MSLIDANTLHSGIYQGSVRHRRLSPKKHAFDYQLYMLGIDVDELANIAQQTKLFGSRWYNPIRFVEKDYIKSEPGHLKARIGNKVRQLGGEWPVQADDSSDWRVTMLAQARCLGLYFSPVNFYFCYDTEQECRYMLAEVSNTPWNERHYYLVDMNVQADTEKVFHVSPFMPIDMQYQWRIKAPEKRCLVHIENHQAEKKVFDATLVLSKQPFSAKAVMATWLSLPAMTFKIVTAIYWQAAKLFFKRVPFVPYPKSAQKS